MSSKKTLHALLGSMLSLILCCSMLLGTTLAWFTDSVTSGGNIIKSGTLDVALYYGDTDNPTLSAENAAIFNYAYWEPGYTQTKFLKIENTGDLAFAYQLHILPNNGAEDALKLAEVIDVYVADATGGFTADRDLTGMIRLGTLRELMAQPTGVDDGVLLPADSAGAEGMTTPAAEYYEGSATVCIALHMQEEAGNEYQGLSVGDGFTVRLIATQYAAEGDSFGHQYDEAPEWPPTDPDPPAGEETP